MFAVSAPLRVFAAGVAATDAQPMVAGSGGIAVVVTDAELPHVMSTRRRLLLAIPSGLVLAAVTAGALAVDWPERMFSESKQVLDICGKN
ncbi:hypothetical protein MAUB_53080 [Mycolicibacterium aubagnense]|uniref:Uncharacterized protein n=1 Tax=Mycolicibacterium aubagnense TaxID=319707 RepID=A0ABN5Z1V3_9MYCO|nr:hypothetical protein [Mycolicibacterium aubagnense]WGI31170.1 hypothetical protein QDT91_18135 [Mycolicibacterium aubagnense]BBX87435.1 hypothetical protein MAUB_53080 [Mycolicibacterium aubagnense]